MYLKTQLQKPYHKNSRGHNSRRLIKLHHAYDVAEKAEVLNQQFHSVFKTSSQESPTTSDNNDMPPISIAAEGVRSQLQKLNPYKATGPDNISPRVLKELADVLARPLAALFQTSLD